MTKDLGFEIELPSGFSEASGQVKDALKQEGFGILAEIDLQAAFREKLGREFRPAARVVRRSHFQRSLPILRWDCSCHAT